MSRMLVLLDWLAMCLKFLLRECNSQTESCLRIHGCSHLLAELLDGAIVAGRNFSSQLRAKGWSEVSEVHCSMWCWTIIWGSSEVFICQWVWTALGKQAKFTRG